MTFRSSSLKSAARAGRPSFNTGNTFSRQFFNAIASLSPPLAFLLTRNKARSTVSKSAKANSVLMVAISSKGLI